jgi:hypothetical protein
MAIAVIGGLITSTLLSLLVVPAGFTFIDDIEQFFKRQLAKRRKGATTTVAPVEPSMMK